VHSESGSKLFHFQKVSKTPYLVNLPASSPKRQLEKIFTKAEENKLNLILFNSVRKLHSGPKILRLNFETMSMISKIMNTENNTNKNISRKVKLVFIECSYFDCYYSL